MSTRYVWGRYEANPEIQTTSQSTGWDFSGGGYLVLLELVSCNIDLTATYRIISSTRLVSGDSYEIAPNTYFVRSYTSVSGTVTYGNGMGVVNSGANGITASCTLSGNTWTLSFSESINVVGVVVSKGSYISDVSGSSQGPYPPCAAAPPALW